MSGDKLKTNKQLEKRVQELLNYNESTGIFRWKFDRGVCKKGGVAGSINPKGYRMMCIDRKTYRAHRLAWLITYGYFPDQIDHINGVRDDNRICNLRVSSQYENCLNRKLGRDNTSGYKGVSWDQKMKKWRVQIRVNLKNNHLGFYEDVELAGLVAQEARQKFHGEYARD